MVLLFHLMMPDVGVTRQESGSSTNSEQGFVCRQMVAICVGNLCGNCRLYQSLATGKCGGNVKPFNVAMMQFNKVTINKPTANGRAD